MWLRSETFIVADPCSGARFLLLFWASSGPSEGPWHLRRFRTASLRKMKLGSVSLEAVLLLKGSKLISLIS